MTNKFYFSLYEFFLSEELANEYQKNDNSTVIEIIDGNDRIPSKMWNQFFKNVYIKKTDEFTDTCNVLCINTQIQSNVDTIISKLTGLKELPKYIIFPHINANNVIYFNGYYNSKLPQYTHVETVFKNEMYKLYSLKTNVTLKEEKEKIPYYIYKRT